MKTPCKTSCVCALIKTRVRRLNNVARHLNSQETLLHMCMYVYLNTGYIYIYTCTTSNAKHMMRIRDTRGSQPRAKPGLTEFIWKM